MKNSYNINNHSKIAKRFAIIFFVLILLTQLKSFSNEHDLLGDYTNVPKSVVLF